MAINLEKGQKIPLPALKQILMGLGWDTGSNRVDLDASCVMLDQNKNVTETIYFRNLKSSNGSVIHTGDNLSGAGAGDDEKIKVDLTKIPSNVEYLVFTVNSFSGQGFRNVKNAYCRIVNSVNGEEIAKILLSEKGSHKALILMKLYRYNGEWKAQAIGKTISSGSTVNALIPDIVAIL